ncbi:MAG: hypothetical protein WBA76_12250 [Phormidesmis sp.]
MLRQSQILGRSQADWPFSESLISHQILYSPKFTGGAREFTGAFWASYFISIPG